jgi:large subunit ribosomal protein L4
MKFKVYSTEGKLLRERDVSDIEVFEGTKGLQAIKDTVVAFRANARRGSRSTKTRGEVSGGGRKPWRQKGTGRARAGSNRSPLWRGGGVVFGPRPQDFSKKVNRKVRSLALRRAFYDRAVAGDIDLIEEIEAPNGKTKEMNALICRLVPKGRVLLIGHQIGKRVRKATDGLKRVSLQSANLINAMDLVDYSKVVITEKALNALMERMNGGRK